jgi:Zn-dependent protease/predicted transcriptional regulator
MSDANIDAAARSAPNPAQRPGVGLGRLFGIEIRLDPSVIIIFLLVVSMLSISVFPSWHPDWSLWLSWTTGLSAGVLFFASLLAHELSHSVVARAYGLPVPRITLFLFGGASEMEDEPDSPKKEFVIAIVGPLTSLVLGFVFATLASNLAGPGFAETFAEDPKAALADLAPLPTLLMWLGPVNVVLGVFNLVPGFPLDGGRVLRALLWWSTGDHLKATRWAANGGRFFGWALIILGVLEIAGGNLGGAWLILIGWFLSSIASSSYSQLVVTNTLRGCKAEDLMRRDFTTVTIDMPVDQFIQQHLMQSAQQLWPVTEDDRVVGYVSLEEVKKLSEEARGQATIRDIAQPDTEPVSVDAGLSAQKAMQVLSSRELPLMVFKERDMVGLLSKAEYMKWLALHQPEPA